MKTSKIEKDAPGNYLSKSFLEELNFKLWATRGARFNCDKRLRTKGKASNAGLTIISAYLIIASLITVFNLELGVSQELLNFTITGLSILVLVFTQFENAQNYELVAKTHHDSGLKISELYNRLRIFKTLQKNPNDDEILNFANDIVGKYENVLSTSGNHSGLDYDLFLVKNIEYLKKNEPDKIKHLNIDKTQRLYFWNVYGWYLLFIILPPSIFILLFFSQSM
ncbi:SLATT domain-containing protein [Zunongwangia sp. F363]|uniref:SLATT domain-containing protein n=1 Tax=Autumnicola tepida TaxID=3075595 RepID=A0ABU3CE76_9FLAO|nr:SLATT domain-containing protein [Zunongwangia sp. F363]MDT0644649.1 SLATT domain-containing protein [Zunongwangia sp. F363]